MSTTVIAVALCAGMFVMFGLLPHRDCSGHCSGCGRSCERYDHEGDTDVG